MQSVAIRKEWFDEIKDKVPYEDPFEYTDATWGKMVEVDVDLETFESVSKELGWIV
jgi:hypothetical protein